MTFAASALRLRRRQKRLTCWRPKAKKARPISVCNAVKPVLMYERLLSRKTSSSRQAAQAPELGQGQQLAAFVEQVQESEHFAKRQKLFHAAIRAKLSPPQAGLAEPEVSDADMDGGGQPLGPDGVKGGSNAW